MMRVILGREAFILASFLAVSTGSAQELPAKRYGQSFEVVADSANATVGDTVTLRFRVRLHERDMLLDTVPRPVERLPAGVRILAVEKLTRAADRVYQGSARVAFYRPGRRAVPVFGLPYMRIVEGIPRATLPSDSAFVVIRAVLPAGDPPLKDIKEAEPSSGSRLVPVLALLVLAAAGLLYRGARKVRRRTPSPPPEPAVPASPPHRTPYERAIERLRRVEREGWPARGDVARHYEALVDVVRQYLEEAEGVAACERTSSELLWALPPHLTAGGLRNRCHAILSQADLVKFAEVRPSEASAAAFLGDARLLLESWHRARLTPEVADAVR
ncbi:MAG TPA: hypothetical protein VF252_12100 [Gemmatimonadales bacterium]